MRMALGLPVEDVDAELQRLQRREERAGLEDAEVKQLLRKGQLERDGFDAGAAVKGVGSAARPTRDAPRPDGAERRKRSRNPEKEEGRAAAEADATRSRKKRASCAKPSRVAIHQRCRTRWATCCSPASTWPGTWMSTPNRHCAAPTKNSSGVSIMSSPGCSRPASSFRPSNSSRWRPSGNRVKKSLDRDTDLDLSFAA